MTGRVERFDTLARRIQVQTGPVRLVAVDGPGGSGKSTFATRLARALGGAQVIHTDDFASHAEPITWWWRLEQQVLIPLAAGRPARYQRYDWDAAELADWITVPPAPVVLIEGVTSARLAVRDRLTLAVWIATDRETRLARGIERDGEALRSFWVDWMAAEDAHFALDPTRPGVDLVVDGQPTVPHHPEREFVRIDP